MLRPYAGTGNLPIRANYLLLQISSLVRKAFGEKGKVGASLVTKELSFAAVCLPQDRDRLIGFLTSEAWPFHVNVRLSEEQIKEMMAEGTFGGSNHECFWILNGVNEVGFIRLIDLDDIGDGYPLFDLRIKHEYRGKGIGKKAVTWLTKYMFHKWPNLDRIVGATRADNSAMRRTFRSCGFAKEGHFRKDWGSSAGITYDSVRYGLLREDWETGRTTPVNWNDEP